MVSAQNTNFYHLVWNKTNLKDVIAENPTKTKLECVDVVADKLKKIQYGLFDLSMRDKATTSANGNSSYEGSQEAEGDEDDDDGGQHAYDAVNTEQADLIQRNGTWIDIYALLQ
ncbi:hypothetical protein E4U30_005104 [Claviceps sp. LM220 group G6]|nr:hypothetical protein E4U30_005104 [Claviceps sp. LM220 group G6]